MLYRRQDVSAQVEGIAHPDDEGMYSHVRVMFTCTEAPPAVSTFSMERRAVAVAYEVAARYLNDSGSIIWIWNAAYLPVVTLVNGGALDARRATLSVPTPRNGDERDMAELYDTLVNLCSDCGIVVAS